MEKVVQSQVKIGFVLLSGPEERMPSTRIAVLNMLPFLVAAGFSPEIVFEPKLSTETPNVEGIADWLIRSEFRIVVFQKVHGPSVIDVARRLSLRGIKTIYLVCDLVNYEMCAATDVTIVVTDYLKSLYPRRLQGKIHVVHDGIEKPDICKDQWSAHTGSRARPLRAVLVTSAKLTRLPIIGAPPEWLRVDIVGPYPARRDVRVRMRELRWTLRAQRSGRACYEYLTFLANRRISCLPWDEAEVYQIMKNADIGIIPIEEAKSHCADGLPALSMRKSENRLTMKMCIGLPVIASSIPSYEPVISQGRNGLLARSANEWGALLALLRDPRTRYDMGTRARESVINRYSQMEQSRLLIDVIVRLLAKGRSPLSEVLERDAR